MTEEPQNCVPNYRKTVESENSTQINQWVTLSLLLLILDIFQHPGSSFSHLLLPPHSNTNFHWLINLQNRCRAFSQKELQDLKSLFNSLASQSQSNGKYISPSIFQVFCFLDDLQYNDWFSSWPNCYFSL
jgi:hypothetical protein